MSKEPIRVAVTGAAGQIGYALLFRIASGQMFGSSQPVILHLIEIEPALPALGGVCMELEDCAFPLLKGTVPTADLDAGLNRVNRPLPAGAGPGTVSWTAVPGTPHPTACWSTRLRPSSAGTAPGRTQRTGIYPRSAHSRLPPPVTALSFPWPGNAPSPQAYYFPGQNGNDLMEYVMHTARPLIHDDFHYGEEEHR